jgi:hypothetical protein
MSEGKIFPNIKSVLVVLSSKSMAFDMPGLRNFITHSYPGAAVFFISTSSQAVGVQAPSQVDLVIDFTPPNARQPMFFARKMKSRAKHVVGRNTGGIFGRKKYDALYDEASDSNIPKDYLDHERFVQRRVLALAGIEIVKQGGATQDLSKEIAQTLPPMQR